MSLTREARIVRRFFNKALGLPLKRFLYESGLGKSLFLDAEGLIRIRKLEMYLTKGCNLKCHYCSHFNPYRHGIVPTETLIGSMETWSKKISPKKISPCRSRKSKFCFRSRLRRTSRMSPSKKLRLGCFFRTTVSAKTKKTESRLTRKSWKSTTAHS